MAGSVRLFTGLVALAASAALAPALIAQTAPADEPTFTRVTLPKDFRETFQRYDRVDKADSKIVRHLSINKEALAKVKPGEPFPDGTILVMQDHDVVLEAGGHPLKDKDGRLLPTQRIKAIAVMEKRAGWGETNLYPADKDNGDWEYAAFKADGSPNPIKLDACYACHLPHKANDYLFTGAKIYEAARR